MPVQFACSHCGQPVTTKDFMVGKVIVCPHCQEKEIVPLPEEPRPKIATRQAPQTMSEVFCPSCGTKYSSVAGLAIRQKICPKCRSVLATLSGHAEPPPVRRAEPESAVAQASIPPAVACDESQEECPERRPPRKSQTIRFGLIVVSLAFLIVIFTLIILSVASGPTGEAIRVDAGELFAAYEKDVIAADMKYTGKTVELTNVTGKAAQESGGRYFLVAAESARFVKTKSQGARVMSGEALHRSMLEGAYGTEYVPGVLLYLDSRDAGKFAGLADKKVTVRGTCKGMRKDDKTEPGFLVVVEEVQLVKR